ncbi:pentapeptide repeat-containing protein [Aeromonas media]|uniref:pentapeptide repeat-containing protein n=1 Tax=Aeromonas media TaxID=651 RepID=UPI002B475C44|nr:pentapeptide repeat-containing protein [Aeromonas media]
MKDIINDATTEYYQKKFNGLKFTDAHLYANVFEECEFVNCSFNGAHFHRCKFVDCTFRNSDLSNLRVDSSRFLAVLYDECKIIGVDWTKAEWSRFVVPGQLIFKKSILNDSSFFGLKLPGMIMEKCKVWAADFRGGDFSKSDFSYSDFTESMFGNTNLNGADFRESMNYGIDIRDNHLKGTKFTRLEAIHLLEGFGFELFD